MSLVTSIRHALVKFALVSVLAFVSTPSQAAGIAGVRDVAVGNFHTCAISRAGEVFCWGNNGFNQLGNGTNVSRPTPGRVPGLSGEFISITAGSFHTCALNTEGTVYCWGAGSQGQLGDGSFDGSGAAVIPIGFEAGARQISAGSSHTCGIDAQNIGRCWGWNGYLQLGSGTDALQIAQPVAVARLPAGVTSIAAAQYHSCALTAEGRMMCWGSNMFGQLGLRQEAVSRGTATNVAFLPLNNLEIAAVGTNSCVLTRLHRLLCWGGNGSGQLGSQVLADQANTPTRVAGLPAGIDSLTIGSFEGYWGTVCVLTRADRSLCWGDNRDGQLGDGSLEDRSAPGAVFGLGAGIQRLAGGVGNHLCAVLRNGTLRCWGQNTSGQLGDGTYLASRVPVPVLGRLHRR